MAIAPVARSAAAETRAVLGIRIGVLVEWGMVRILPSVDARDGESDDGSTQGM
jgi:hypothetical protein